jgi:hypothetical protein
VTAATAASSHIGFDHHGGAYHDLGPHPRKELLARLGRKSAAKMYRDGANGAVHHVGYIIAGLWIELFRIERFDGRVE